MLWAQLREAVHNDDITSVLVTRPPDQPIDQIFQQELQKHQQLVSDGLNFVQKSWLIIAVIFLAQYSFVVNCRKRFVYCI